MADSTQQDGPSPYHPGELEVQERMGVEKKAAVIGRRMIRDHMVEQHIEFYALLETLFIGSVDDKGRPWVSVVCGSPGFISIPNDKKLVVNAKNLPSDPLSSNLGVGAQVGILGLQFETRRRNRLTGVVREVFSDRFEIEVKQSFGNCPQFIQTRTFNSTPALCNQALGQYPITKSSGFDRATQDLIARADTMFIASSYLENPESASAGADASHRGGKPGFVKVIDDQSFTFPDFGGNNAYNTIGNLTRNPKAGFLFLDFETRDLVFTTGSAEISWDPEQLARYQYAQHIIKFTAEETIRIGGAFPFDHRFQEFSPTLAKTGNWKDE